MTDYSMTIAGKPVAGGAAFGVVNPATGAEVAQAPDCSDAELDAAVAAAADAYRDWRRDDDLRRDAMRAAARVLESAAPELGAILTREEGKPVGEATTEIFGGPYWLDYYAGIEVTPEVIQDDAAARVELRRQPLGPVAAITPWNFPVALSFWKIAPALRAGNTVVLKPSPYTPLTCLRIGELLTGVLPPGVLNVISGRDPLGAKPSAHPGIRKISFTGSTATGKKVAATAAEDLKRVTLELGGNDPAIVLDDADPASVAAGIFASAMANAGQVCVAIKRAYVPRGMFGDVVDALAAHASQARLGDGFGEGVTMGPVNNAPQFARVRGLVEAALSAGATAVTGGRPLDGPGYFYQPTILTGVTDDMAVVAKEQFGPALPVLPYDDLEEAVARANDSHFGLGSSIWTGDPQRGARLAREIQAGATWINSHLILLPAQPFGGVKWSGIGMENGLPGLHEFTDVHVIYQARAAGDERG
jgi:acyl-CoA reductase-like NAD-dependent aldehyde dehydrogenase